MRKTNCLFHPYFLVSSLLLSSVQAADLDDLKLCSPSNVQEDGKNKSTSTKRGSETMKKN